MHAAALAEGATWRCSSRCCSASVAAWARCGICVRTTRRAAAAARSMALCRAAQPTRALALEIRAGCLYRQGRLEEARDACRQGVEAAPDYAALRAAAFPGA